MPREYRCLFRSGERVRIKVTRGPLALHLLTMKRLMIALREMRMYLSRNDHLFREVEPAPPELGRVEALTGRYVHSCPTLLQ